MSAIVIDGKAVAAGIEETIAAQVQALRLRGITPGLTAIRVGEDPASEIYVASKARKAHALGLNGRQIHLPANISEVELLSEIARLNADDDVDGILVQLPLPRHIDTRRVIEAIAVEKDVDGFHPINVGRLHGGQKSLVPCTPAGVMALIASTGESVRGKNALVIGRSDIVGKPVAALLLQQDATVTIAHSRSRDLDELLRQAEIVVAAVGRPMIVKGASIREGAMVLDVGINRVDLDSPDRASLPENKQRILAKNGFTIVGDVDYPGAIERAGWITPVPGGVGPMTIVMLMQNTLQAALDRRG